MQPYAGVQPVASSFREVGLLSPNTSYGPLVNDELILVEASLFQRMTQLGPSSKGPFPACDKSGPPGTLKINIYQGHEVAKAYAICVRVIEDPARWLQMLPENHTVFRYILAVVIFRVPGLLVMAIKTIVVVMFQGQKLLGLRPLKNALDDLMIANIRGACFR